MTEQSNSNTTSIVHRVSIGNADLGAQSKLQRLMANAIVAIESHDTALSQLLEVVQTQHPNARLAFVGRDTSDRLVWTGAEGLFEYLPYGSRETIHGWVNEACHTGHAIFSDVSGAEAWWVFVVPVLRQSLAPEVLCAAIKKSDGNRIGLAGALQLAASHLTLFDLLQSQRRERVEAKQSLELLQLIRKLDTCDDWEKSTFVLVNELHKQFGCEQVALGVPEGSKANCRVVAVSGVSHVDQRSSFAEQVAAAMNEAILRRKTTVVDREILKQEEGTLAHQDLLLTTRCRRLISAPMFGENREPIGVVTLWDNRSDAAFGETLGLVRRSNSVIDGHLRVIRRSAVHPFKRAVQRITRANSRNKLIGIVVSIGVFASVMALPMPYKIGCECNVEPVLRRFIAAPYDGMLEESLVEAGDVVVAGQTLARMDARELRWELSGFEADYKSEQKKRDAASARDDIAVAQQSDLEMQRLSLKMDLLRHRLENLEIKSPIDGVVIEGDLKKAEGIPLTVGQTLFEIGPLDQMIVELSVPERDVLHVEPGMPVEITLEADQSETISGTLLRTAPRSEIRESESVYIAELLLSNEHQKYRPGMKGSATISGNRHPLGWNWFHHAWESFASWIGV